MADSMRTAEYSKEDGPYVLPVGFQQLSTTELTALQTAKRLNIGSLYLDMTLNKYRIASRKDAIQGYLILEGNPADLTISSAFISGRTDTSGTPGNATINSITGRVAIAAAATAITITNSRVTTNSEIFLQLRAARDATLTEVRVTGQSAGSFTVTGNAAATAAVSFSFWVVN